METGCDAGDRQIRYLHVVGHRRGSGASQPRGINQRDLAEEVGVNPGALVRLLDQAAALGFLERQESAGDRRFKTLRILPAGAELAQKVETAADKLRVELMHDVPLEDIETATRILRLFEERAGHYLQQAGNEP